MSTISSVSTRPAASLSASTLRVLFLSSLGGMLEYYDFVIFVFFTPFISKLFFPASMPEWLRQFQTFGIFSAGYLARPIGGVLMAHFGDLRGRKKVFMLTVLLMAIPTFAIGILPTYQAIGATAPMLLLALRILQGMAVGGDLPGGCVFVAEHAKEKTGLAIGLFMAGPASGAALGSLVTTIIEFKFLPEQIIGGAWRLPFLLGGIFGFAAMFLRRYLAETPIFQEMKKRAVIAKEIPLRIIFRDHRAAILPAVGSAWALSAIVIVVALMSPTVLVKMYHLPLRDVQLANVIGILGSSLGGILVGAAVDRFGLRRLIAPILLLSIGGIYLLYLGPGWMPSALPLFSLVAGVGISALNMAPLAIVRAFPATVRFTGVSFTYNLASALAGGTTLLVVSWFSRSIPLFPAHYAVALMLVGIVAMLLAPIARSEY